MNKHRVRGFVAAGLAGALALGFGVSAMAFADDPSNPGTGGPTVDPAYVGSLTITKLEGPASTASASGSEQTGLSNTAIDGVQFRVCMVLDLSDPASTSWNDDWATLQAESSTNPTSPADLVSAYKCIDAKYDMLGSTGIVGSMDSSSANVTSGPVQGQVSFRNMPVGLYLVQEVTEPGGVTPSDPFLVSIPTANASAQLDGSDTWLYDVYVYPKNSLITVSKTVKDNYFMSDGMTYTIKTSVPANFAVEDSWFQIRDSIEGCATIDEAHIDITVGNNIQIFRSEYSFTNNVIIFNTAGLHKLATNRRRQITITMPATVQPDGGAGCTTVGGEIVNTAYVCANSGCHIGSLTEPTASLPIITQYGEIDISKTDKTASSIVLSGAEFTLYKGNAANTGPDIDSPICPTNESTCVWTSDSDGTVSITGLRYSNLMNGVTATQDPGYWLVETKAPAGYLIDDIGKQVYVNDETTKSGTESVPADFTDTKITTPVLPQTGGFVSVTAFASYIIGAALLGSLVLLVVRRKRQQEEAQA